MRSVHPRMAVTILLAFAMVFTSFGTTLAQGYEEYGNEPVPAAQPAAQMQEVLDAIASLEQPPTQSLSPFNARNLPGGPYWVQLAATRAGGSIKTEIVGDVSHITMPGAGGDILARVYTPEGDGPFPVLVYFHGGGWVIASLNTYDSSARALTNAANAIVVSVAYRQAPEAPFPAAMNDAYTAYQWVVENAAQINGDPNNVAVAGESAGGNLAAVVSLRARNEGFQMPVHQLLVYPVTNYAFDTPSYETYANAAPLGRELMMWFWGHYLPNPEAGDDPYASPLRADDLSGLPPATVILADIDPLQSEGRAYAQRLMDAGVPTTLELFDGTTHEFFGMAPFVPQAIDAVALAGAELRASFGSSPAPGPGKDGQHFPETGHTVSGTFLRFWDHNGGLLVFGYPITDQFDEENADTGEVYPTQYFERQRFEHHSANAGTPYEVLLGRLGVEVLLADGRDWQTFPTADASAEGYFAETGHAIAPEFWSYWSSHGLDFGDDGTSYRESLALFGYPTSEPEMEENSSGDMVLTQWFERARFEFHPDNDAEYQVLLGHLGAELWASQQ